MNLTARLKEYAAIPEQLQQATRGIAVMVLLTGLIALIALTVSVVALERISSNGH